LHVHIDNLTNSAYLFCEVEPTLFASFSGKRRAMGDNILISFLGPAPDPVVPLRGSFFYCHTILRSRTTLFASFSGKRREELWEIL
jgi:hypothetical protein